mgnify:CR=1 FL=1
MAYCGECTYLNLNDPDSYGRFWCEKCLERHAANEFECYRYCKAYSRSDSVSKIAYNYSIEHSKEPGCYLTTMLCNILKMEDKNYFLQTMRYFRNNVLQKDDKYKPLLVEYDIIGPYIAHGLSNDPLKYQIAATTFYKYIKPITNYIKEENNECAVNKYVEMTNMLRNIYINKDMNIEQSLIANADIKESGHGIYKTKKLHV